MTVNSGSECVIMINFVIIRVDEMYKSDGVSSKRSFKCYGLNTTMNMGSLPVYNMSLFRAPLMWYTLLKKYEGNSVGACPVIKRRCVGYLGTAC